MRLRVSLRLTLMFASRTDSSWSTERLTDRGQALRERLRWAKKIRLTAREADIVCAALWQRRAARTHKEVEAHRDAHKDDANPFKIVAYMSQLQAASAMRHLGVTAADQQFS